MSVPPPGGWPPPQQPGQPPHQGQPYGPSGYDPQQPPPGWQQGGWPQQQVPPPQKGNSLKWLLIGVAVLLVIGISVGATVLFTRGSGDGGTNTPTSAVTGDIASANDTGPISVVTDEPTCSAFVGVNNSLSDLQAKGWASQRASLGPVSEWTPDQQAQVQAVAVAIRNAIDRLIPLAKQTPHRLVRELYEQFIAYGRLYVDSIPTYRPEDNALASSNVNASTALVGICNSITFGSASRSLSVPAAKPPTKVADLTDPTNAKHFTSSQDPICSSFQDASNQFETDPAVVAWKTLDGEVSGAQWTPEQQAIQAGVRQPMTKWADNMEEAGRSSNSPTTEDFAVAAAAYLRAYSSAGSTYVSADGWLSYTAFRLNNLILSACRSAG